MNAMLKQFVAAVMIVAVVSCASAQGQASRPASRPAATTQAGTSDISDRLVGSSENRQVGSGRQDIWTQWGRTLAALALVVVLIIVARFMLKRFGPVSGARGAGVLDVLARTSVSSRHQLLLVRVGRRIVLVAQAPTSMTAISEITDPDEAAALIEAASSRAGKREESK